MPEIIEQDKMVGLFGGEFNITPEAVVVGRLRDRFVISPFSVLNARQGDWQDRKHQWIYLGIKGEEGRDEIVPGGAGETSVRRDINKYNREFGQQQTGPNSPYRTKGYKQPNPNTFGSGAPGDLSAEFKERDKNIAEKKGFTYAAAENGGLDEKTQRALGVYAAPGGVVVRRGQGHGGGTPMEAGLCYGEVPSYDGAARGVSGTSVFDPVLCECMYRWFAPPDGRILDPFAGESTKGIVAGFLGYEYTGIELRSEQVEANDKQADIVSNRVQEIIGAGIKKPTWLLGDSAKLSDILDEYDPFAEFDFIWTSPPYYDLEIYSASEKDGSAFETYPKFMAWYEDIFRQAVARLKPNRFLAVKIGEIRDDDGFYRNFVGDNISVFRKLGLNYYNEIILMTAVGSLPVRVASQFPNYRKIGKTHQNVLLFYKGDNCKVIPEQLGVLSRAVLPDDCVSQPDIKEEENRGE